MKKVLSSLLIVISILVVMPIQANAEWKHDNRGWYYIEGKSYAKGWRNIDGKWYYFWLDGEMAADTWVDIGYYVDKNGVWTKTAKYTMNDIMIDYCATGNKGHYSIGGDYKSYIGEYIGQEPCLFVFRDDYKEAYIGLNTLNVYDAYSKKIIDTVKLLQ